MNVTLTFQSVNPESSGIIGYLVIQGKREDYKKIFPFKQVLKQVVANEKITEGGEITCIKPKLINKRILLLQDKQRENHIIIDEKGKMEKIPIPLKTKHKQTVQL